MMILNGEEGLECEVHVDGTRLEHVSEFKHLGCILDEAGTDGAECSRKMASGRRVVDTTRYLFNARDLQLECVKNIACTCSYVCQYDNVMEREGEI